MSGSDVADFVRNLRSIDPTQYGPDNVGRLIADVRFGVEAVKPYLSFRERCYTRNLVFKNDDFEVAILCWDAGAVSPVHDHSAQRCWQTALEGTFDVENYSRVAGGLAEGYARLDRLDTVYGLRTGQPDYRYGDNDVHRVSVSPSQSHAVSLHVYAKPLTACLVYDYEGQRCSYQRLGYDTIATDRLAQLLRH
jgi:predicted metal-dependent enzyme (double-stranded beta helix superfamily)